MMTWRKCSTCKNEINYSSKYQQCSISTCRKWAFCSVDCWDTHNSVMNHRNGWAEENISPDKMSTDVNASSPERSPRRIMVQSKNVAGVIPKGNYPREVLIVVSKLKAYVKARHDMNTSANVMERLSDMVRIICDEAAEKAQSEGRKTIMDRDFQ